MSEDQPLPSNAALEVVQMNFRYTGAWNEVNARIAQRQSALNMFVAFSGVLITALLSSNSENELRYNVFNPNWLCGFILIASIVFGFLNYKHDKTIALLRDFMADCEMRSKIHYKQIELLGYNSNSAYRKHADNIRNYHDFACFILIVLFNGVGFFVAYTQFKTVFYITGWPFIFYLAGIAWASWFVLRSTLKPYNFRTIQTL